MGTGTALVLIGGMAGVTYLTRLPLFLLSVRRVRLPRLVDRVLEEIPVAAFAAIVFSTALAPGGKLDLHLSNLYVYAALAAIATAALTRSVLGTIVIGCATAVVLEQLFR